MITTTLKALREADACVEGYNKLVRTLQGKEFTEEEVGRSTYFRHRHDDPIALTYILESNGLDDALWALRASNVTDRDARLFAVTCARRVQHLMEDPRSVNALDVAERFANGEATYEELAAAQDAAKEAAQDATWYATWYAARVAIWYAARVAARYAAHVADDWDAEIQFQKELFIKMCNGEAPWQA